MLIFCFIKRNNWDYTPQFLFNLNMNLYTNIINSSFSIFFNYVNNFFFIIHSASHLSQNKNTSEIPWFYSIEHSFVCQCEFLKSGGCLDYGHSSGKLDFKMYNHERIFIFHICHSLSLIRNRELSQLTSLLPLGCTTCPWYTFTITR